MTEQDNILRLAREAGLVWHGPIDEATFLRFAALVKAEAVAETREAIAEWIEPQRNFIPATGAEFAAAIRAMAATQSREGGA